MKPAAIAAGRLSGLIVLVFLLAVAWKLMLGDTMPRDVQEDGPRINQEIRAREVRLIDKDGHDRGNVPIADALALAQESGLDLVEIAPEAEPPVCKLLDYGKYKYKYQD